MLGIADLFWMETDRKKNLKTQTVFNISQVCIVFIVKAYEKEEG